jgi:hypothetical protein
MTREDIIRMAREAGCEVYDGGDIAPALVRLTTLVAEAEREACAKVCEDIEMRNTLQGPADCAVAIRARGSK